MFSLSVCLDEEDDDVDLDGGEETEDGGFTGGTGNSGVPRMQQQHLAQSTNWNQLAQMEEDGKISCTEIIMLVTHNLHHSIQADQKYRIFHFY